MRYVRFSTERDELNYFKIEIDRYIASKSDLGEIMKNAQIDRDWIEGIGCPSCSYDLSVWHTVGNFLLASTY